MLGHDSAVSSALDVSSEAGRLFLYGSRSRIEYRQALEAVGGDVSKMPADALKQTPRRARTVLYEDSAISSAVRYCMRCETKRAKDPDSLWHRLGFQMGLRKEGQPTAMWAKELGLPDAPEAYKMFGDMVIGSVDQACFGGVSEEVGPSSVESDLSGADNAYRGSVGFSDVQGPWDFLDKSCTGQRNSALFNSCVPN